MKIKVSDNVIGQLQQLAKQAYGHGSVSAGSGRIGMLGDRVVKFNTHHDERWHGPKVNSEMLKSCDALREHLGRIARDVYGTNMTKAMKKILKQLGLNESGELKVSQKSLLDRSVVVKFIDRLKLDTDIMSRGFRDVRGAATMKNSSWEKMPGNAVTIAVTEFHQQRKALGDKDAGAKTNLALLLLSGMRTMEQVFQIVKQTEKSGGGAFNKRMLEEQLNQFLLKNAGLYAYNVSRLGKVASSGVQEMSKHITLLSKAAKDPVGLGPVTVPIATSDILSEVNGILKNKLKDANENVEGFQFNAAKSGIAKYGSTWTIKLGETEFHRMPGETDQDWADRVEKELKDFFGDGDKNIGILLDRMFQEGLESGMQWKLADPSQETETPVRVSMNEKDDPAITLSFSKESNGSYTITETREKIAPKGFSLVPPGETETNHNFTTENPQGGDYIKTSYSFNVNPNGWAPGNGNVPTVSIPENPPSQFEFNLSAEYKRVDGGY